MAFLASGMRRNPDALSCGFYPTRRRLNRWQGVSRRGKGAQALLLMEKMRSKLKDLFKPVECPSQVDSTMPRALDRLERYHAYRTIMMGYIPGYYPGRVILLRTESMQARMPGDPTLGWRHVTSHLDVRPISGDHHTCLTEHLESLAACLTDCLRASV